MKLWAVFISSAALVLGAGDSTIPTGSKIYISSNNGFDIFVVAALQAKHVEVKMVQSEDAADFILDSSLFHNDVVVAGAGASRDGGAAFSTNGRTSEAAFKLTSRGGDIAWACAASKGILARGKQSVAESCAKNLKEFMDGGSKKKKGHSH